MADEWACVRPFVSSADRFVALPGVSVRLCSSRRAWPVGSPAAARPDGTELLDVDLPELAGANALVPARAAVGRSVKPGGAAVAPQNRVDRERWRRPARVAAGLVRKSLVQNRVCRDAPAQTPGIVRGRGLRLARTARCLGNAAAHLGDPTNERPSGCPPFRLLRSLTVTLRGDALNSYLQNRQDHEATHVLHLR
jgi:hypothetical protein